MPTFVHENWRKVSGTLRERCVDSGSMRIGERSITISVKVFDSVIDDADTSYRSSSSVVLVTCLHEKPHLVESRQYMLAGLRVEGPEPRAFVHSDLEARRLVEFLSNTLHEFG